ncbi:hypothetical protein H6P81_011551 [Aristolochia fimbriata]|uniref:Annexin n=1 Tax=Aristolochia fimbriata TaxID=158543 RepID=A0AAV7EUU0_ARIFI|nr:hypothetical protein H6P81_011551 [Aristolochia fimbriata]
MATSHISKKYVSDCQHLQHYFSGNEASSSKKMMEILTSRKPEDYKLIRQTYSALYNSDLLYMLSGIKRHKNLAMVAYLRICEPHERDAQSLRGGLVGSCVDLNTITEILCTRSTLDLQNVRQAYLTKYNADIGQDVVLKTNGNTKEVFRAILNSTRFSGARVDASMAMCDAKMIYEAMESGKSIDRKTIFSIISQRNSGQLKAILQAYKQLYGHDFSQSLKQTKSGEFGKELLVIIKCIQYPEKHFAKQLQRAVEKGSAQEALIRVVSTRAGSDIKGIKTAFSAKTGWSLESLVRSEFSNTENGNGLVADVLVGLLK